ncbi:uncharacterized protein isoform X12 [Rhodnius prolixus]|uniref:uncharacterized protein isoform X12 n=1 Tax=Rhodnius prolixus TaxID=13249 RepID=UPI003D18C715
MDDPDAGVSWKLEMAEVAKSVVRDSLADEDDGCAVEPPEEISLQELIDTELALRVPLNSSPIKSNHCFTSDFLQAEREHSSAGLDSNRLSSPSARLDVLTLNEKNLSTMNGNSNDHIIESGRNINIIEQNDEQTNDWTTVEEVAREIVGTVHEESVGNGHVDENRVQFNTKEYIEHTETEIVIETITTRTTTLSSEESETESVETSVTEKKKKKKTSNECGEVTLTKSKKTKKSKKTEEKENHISVITNGHAPEEQREPAFSPNSSIDDDELSNVCVKDLKLTYVNEANKSYSESKKPSEIPVPPPVPIRELTRSFGDIHKACEHAELSESNRNDPLRAQSLGDLTRIDKQPPIYTGVNVKELAASYWKAVSIENNLDIPNSPRSSHLYKSSFSKFDQLSKKVLHVRSSDPAKASKTFNQTSPDGTGTSTCKACDKTVFAMEQIKAERAVWHKNCFRCHTCKKQLTVDIYSSHEGELYCKPHFKELFKPKVIVDDEEPASDKPDLGLEELSSLNVKSRFQVFEKQEVGDSNLERSPTTVSVKRSSSILSKLAKFQKKGMDVGVSDEALNGFVYEESESSEEEEEENEEEEKGIVKCRRKIRERPVSFTKIDDVKKSWESQQDMMTRREEMREQRKEELQQIRSRLFMGKQGKMKELYEQAVAESEGKTGKKELENEIMKSERARVVREKFEKGETVQSDEEDGGGGGKNRGVEEDMSVFEEGISKKSRSIFLEMDANAVRSQNSVSLTSTPPPRDNMVIKKGRETESPEREVYRDPDVVRADDKLEDEQTILKSQTTSRMLSKFRQLEEQKEVVPEGLKPKKCFTPPPDFKGSAGSSEEESDEEDDEEEDDEEEEESETEDGVVKSSYKVKDEFLEQAKNAARAKQLAAKFESWEPEKQSNNNAIAMLESEHASIDSTKSLRAKFESLKTEAPKEKARPKVNRFVDSGSPALCASCSRKVYPLEKIETNGKAYHKACFRCSYCNCILRMDSYTLNNDHLYCLPHYKQLFISKGNYDEGFGSDQHKRKWDSPTATTTC